MKKTILLLAIITISAVSFPLKAEGTLELKRIWASESILKIPESVIYDPVDSVLYVSNINGNALKADGQGFISKLSTSGKILQLQWITDLNAPKGMGIIGRKLYVTDLTELVEIDISGSEVINKYTIPDAKLANDIATDVSGNVYISDTTRDNDTIYRFTAGKVEPWFHHDGITRPNGLLFSGNILYAGGSGSKKIAKIDHLEGDLIDIVHVGSLIDGLVDIGNDQLIFSDWYGKIFLLQDFEEVSLLLDTIPDQYNAADIFYVQELEMLLVPTFFDNRIMAYEIVEKVVK